ncbi:MAG TPA: pyrroline-5-carboxylate reductase [Candidatus Binataceae bacterium]|nr:pyrroline-5-carboxylate reductase [Candidatus Binataceae bacterium]
MRKLGFVGAGNMGQALAKGLVAHKVFKPAELIASDVDGTRRRKFSRATKIEAVRDNLRVVREAPAILLAVKPQTINEVLAEIGAELAREGIAARKLFVSIAAGVPIARIQSHLGAGSRVVRVMPNAPAMVGEGMAALVRGDSATRADEAFALKLFRAVGRAVSLRDEKLLDAVTALSGSGPAYVYLFVKAMADAGEEQGLPSALAYEMALQTLCGAAAQMRQSKLPVEELIKVVASPGGTTEAALRSFGGNGFPGVVAAAIKAAADRSRELGA